MYAKVFLLFLCFAFIGCRTVKPIVPDYLDGAVEVRDDLAGISSGQTELAITGTEIENTGNNIEGSVNQLEQSIENGAGKDGSFEEIIREVRKRPLE